MKNYSHQQTKLQREREKLNRLVDEALNNGTPICATYAIMAQSKKVNALIDSTKSKKKIWFPNY